jgi:uroporphyrin-III C-methyltransferase
MRNELSPSVPAPPGRSTTPQKGHVYLVGAGPGDAELLTLRASHLLATADAILHDDLVPSAILATARTSALIINVGKRCGLKSITQTQINALMIETARNGLSVVRLKSGDPLIFGRAAEEIDALRSAHTPFDVIPGVTSALAAAAALRVSLTDRRTSSGVHFATANHAAHDQLPQYSEDSTHVIFMPGRSLPALAEKWLQDGADPNLPCAIVSRAAQPDQHVQHTTLGSLRLAEPTPTPSLLLAGWALASAIPQPQTQVQIEELIETRS